MRGQQGTRWTPDRVAIVLGVAGSMAGNVAWSWPRSPVLVGVGVCMSLVLPVAVWLWRATPAEPGTWAARGRAAAMAAVCAGAGLYSVVHTTLLLRNPTHAGVDPAEGLPVLIAWVPVVVMELLVVMAARAGAVQRAGASPRRESRPAKTAAPSRPAQPPRVPAPPPVPPAPVSPARPQLVPEPPPAVDGDEPPVPGETPEDKRRRQERNKKRRQRAKKATEQDTTTAEEGAG